MGAIAALLVLRVSSLASYCSEFRIGFAALLVLYAGTWLLGKNDFRVRSTIVSGVVVMARVKSSCSSGCAFGISRIRNPTRLFAKYP